MEVRAIPICVDVDTEQNISIDAIEKAVTQKTKAIIVVHLNGNPARIEKIEQRFKNTNIKIIEDAAQSFGAVDANGIKTGALGIAASFSMHPLKNLAVYGDGGFVSTSDDELASKIKLLRNHGLKNRDESAIWGYNSRLDELQAAYALIKLKYIGEWTEKYIKIAEKYKKN